MAMRDRFESFNEDARVAVSHAQKDAQRLGHTYIDTEHLLLGLVETENGTADAVLRNLGVEPGKMRNAVEYILGRAGHVTEGEIGLTPRAKQVIELAVEEARRLNHHYLGTEHLLLGLIREGEGIAAGVLEGFGVSLAKARTQTVIVLSQSRADRGPRATPADAATPVGHVLRLSGTARPRVNPFAWAVPAGLLLLLAANLALGVSGLLGAAPAAGGTAVAVAAIQLAWASAMLLFLAWLSARESRPSVCVLALASGAAFALMSVLSGTVPTVASVHGVFQIATVAAGVLVAVIAGVTLVFMPAAVRTYPR